MAKAPHLVEGLPFRPTSKGTAHNLTKYPTPFFAATTANPHPLATTPYPSPILPCPSYSPFPLLAFLNALRRISSCIRLLMELTRGPFRPPTTGVRYSRIHSKILKTINITRQDKTRQDNTRDTDNEELKGSGWARGQVSSADGKGR